jgi:hypothetical protein
VVYDDATQRCLTVSTSQTPPNIITSPLVMPASVLRGITQCGVFPPLPSNIISLSRSFWKSFPFGLTSEELSMHTWAALDVRADSTPTPASALHARGQSGRAAAGLRASLRPARTQLRFLVTRSICPAVTRPDSQISEPNIVDIGICYRAWAGERGCVGDGARRGAS